MLQRWAVSGGNVLHICGELLQNSQVKMIIWPVIMTLSCCRNTRFDLNRGVVFFPSAQMSVLFCHSPLWHIPCYPLLVNKNFRVQSSKTAQERALHKQHKVQEHGKNYRN